MPSVLITEFMDEPAVQMLAKQVTVQYQPELFSQPDALLAQVIGMDALIVRNRTQVNEPLLKQADKLKVVGRLGVGLDNIDLATCKTLGIEVAPATGANSVAVAEYVIGAMFDLLRPITTGFDSVVDGKWPRTQMIGRELAGKTLGLIGMGDIAREVAKRAEAFAMQVVYFDPYVAAGTTPYQSMASLDELLAAAECISLHVPLNDATRNLINANRLRQMKAGAILINTARGGVVDEIALVNALKAGHVGGAALDVFEEEPMSADYGSRFAGVANLILTPHIAGVTSESNERVSHVTAVNVLKALGLKEQ